MQPKERGKYSVLISAYVLSRISYLYLQEHGLNDVFDLFLLLFICLIPAAMMVYPNYFSRTILSAMGVGWFSRFATDAKAPERSAFAIKLLGYIMMAMIYVGFESSA